MVARVEPVAGGAFEPRRAAGNQRHAMFGVLPVAMLEGFGGVGEAPGDAVLVGALCSLNDKAHNALRLLRSSGTRLPESLLLLIFSKRFSQQKREIVQSSKRQPRNAADEISRLHNYIILL